MDERIGVMNLPQAVIARILKEENVVLSKESKETISRAAAVFLINLSGLACQKAKENKHKTIGAEDVLKALIGMDNNSIYKECKKAVDDWKIIKQQKAMARKNQVQNEPTSGVIEGPIPTDEMIE